MPGSSSTHQTGPSTGGRPRFAGRTGPLEAVRELLEPGRHGALLLWGPRGIGRSALLHHLAGRLPASIPCRTVVFDPEDRGGGTLPDLVLSLATAIAARLSLPAPMLGMDVEQTFRMQWLPAALQSIPDGAPLLLLVDEFPGTGLSQTAKSFYGWLHGLLERNRRIRAVLAVGRRSDDRTWLTGNGFGGAPQVRLGMLSMEELEALVRGVSPDGGPAWQQEALEKVMALSGGHPMLAGILAEKSVERAVMSRKNVSTALVESAAPLALGGGNLALEALWDGLSDASRAVTAVMAEVGPEPVPLSAVGLRLRSAGLEGAISGLELAGAELRDGEILERVGGGLHFRSELFRQFIAAHKPPARVLEEMGHGDQAARQLFRAAQALHDRGALEEAAGLLKKALELSPQHVPAAALLGDCLRGLNRLEEARTVLEPLFDRHPSVARTRLVEVIEAMAQATPDEAAKQALLERALEIDPHHRPILQALDALWLERGSRARKRGRLQEALDAFRKADRPDLAHEVARELRLRELETRMAPVYTLEAEERYGEQLQLIKQLAHEFEDVQDWSPLVERVKRRIRMQELYRRGTDALTAGERRQAIGLLEQVVELDRGFKDAARLLDEALRQAGGSGPSLAGGMAAPEVQPLRLVYPPEGGGDGRGHAARGGGEEGEGLSIRSGGGETVDGGSAGGALAGATALEVVRRVESPVGPGTDRPRRKMPRWAVALIGLLNLTPIVWWWVVSSGSPPLEPEASAHALSAASPTPAPEPTATPAPEHLRPAASSPPPRADRSIPVAILQKECEHGDMASCFSLAWAYRNGTSTPRDERRAAQLFQRACDHGDGSSCNSLAIQYQTGAGVPREPKRAMALYQRACDDGELNACRNLGVMYQEGEGQTRDPRRAASLYRKACTERRVEGCANLGMLLETGQGVPKDRKKAIQLFRQACDGGDLHGCQELAARHATGRGVAKDVKLAAALYKRACDGGRKEACESLKGLEPPTPAPQR